ncbi:MAG: hypothetical protein BJ554DRAFT_6652, partial [Olpidium bornovanus]
MYMMMTTGTLSADVSATVVDEPLKAAPARDSFNNPNFKVTPNEFNDDCENNRDFAAGVSERHPADVALRPRVPLLRRQQVPVCGQLRVLFHPEALFIAEAQEVLRQSVALLCR